MKSNIILFLSYTSAMMSSVFIPNLAMELGATNTEIGLIGASYGLTIFLSSFIFGRASDMRDRRSFLKLGLFSATVFFFLQIFAYDVRSLIIIRGLAGFSLGIFTAPLIAYTYESGRKLGNFASYGSLGWAFGGLLAGVIAQQGEAFIYINTLLPYWAVFLLSSVFFLISLLIALRLPEVMMVRVSVPLFPKDVIKKNWVVYLPVFLRHTAAFSIWIIFPLYLAELGATRFWIGAMYFINAGTQFFIMRQLDWKNDVRLINIGLVVSALVFLSYVFPDNFYQVIPIQILLAISFSYLYVGNLKYLTDNNREKSTSVGILNSVTSISMAVGPLLGGAIAQIGGGFHAVMYFAAGLAFIGLAVSLFKL